MKSASTTKHFTFCWNGHQGDRNASQHYLEYFDQGTQLFNNTSTNRYALLFQLSNDPTVDEVSDNTVAASLFGAPLFINIFPRDGVYHALVAGSPRAASRLIEVHKDSVMFVKDRNGKVHEVPLDRLYRVCNRLEKFSLNCKHCPLDPEAGPGGCIETTLRQWCKNHGIDPYLFKSTKDGADHLDPKELEWRMKQTNSNGYVFASPRVTRRHLVRPPYGKVNLVRHWSGNFLENIEQNHEDASKRSKKAAVSRAAHRICDARCFYAGDCARRHTSWRSRAHDCQHPYDSESSWWKSIHHMPGPYSEEEAIEVYRQWYEPERSVEEITYIVHNAGNRLFHFPYELQLVGMDSAMDQVVFRGVRRRYDLLRFFTYEDAMELLRTPAYVSSGKTYVKAYLKDPPRLLTEKEQLLYAELRNFRYSGENYGFGFSGASITSIKWRPGTDSFEVIAHTGRRRSVCSLADMQNIFGLRSTINSFSWSRSKEGVEGVCRESSPGILL